MDAFTSLEEAKAYRFGCWAGQPKGTEYNPTRCAASVHDALTFKFYQCSRKPGHGPASLYCKQHAPRAEALVAARKAKDEGGGG